MHSAIVLSPEGRLWAATSEAKVNSQTAFHAVIEALVDPSAMLKVSAFAFPHQIQILDSQSKVC